MHLVTIQGSSALTEFRLKQLTQTLSQVRRDLSDIKIEAEFIYLLQVKEPLDPSSEARCHQLLSTGSQSKAVAPSNARFYVTPRKATCSPWSSKATDIFHNCSLQTVQRVERGIQYQIRYGNNQSLEAEALGAAAKELYDPMTEGIYTDLSDFFDRPEPSSFKTLKLLEEGRPALEKANREWGLAMSPAEIEYLYKAYTDIKRNPTDVELVMFSQVNSEHCRHKIFNADWIVDGEQSPHSLFQMIRNTYKQNPEGVCTAYSDNSGVLLGKPGAWWEVRQDDSKSYQKTQTRLDLLCKVETHNHPTAISPFPGAATGVGGEIRDEGATGIGGRSKAGLSAFMVSHLNIPGFEQVWELSDQTHPKRLATPLQIMLEAPIGGATFGNEFGRPQLCGLFRSFEMLHDDQLRGYHKPIMAAGGMGNLKDKHVAKRDIPPQALILQIGGPAMKIGLGGGAASSIGAGSQSEALDFDSVQRDNPEMQRRCQQVIDHCIALGSANPILSIHDIGAGGLSNGLPELVEATGGHFHLRKIHNQDFSMSPMEIWCNEAQERYVLAILPEDENRFAQICQRERCPFALVGVASDDAQLKLIDSHFNNEPIDIEMAILLGKTPKMVRECSRKIAHKESINFENITLSEAIDRVLKFPAVANKSFLITIADRSITGMVSRDQMVGAWQTPVADMAVTTTTLESYTGEAMAMGERTPLALLDAPASGRMAIGECLTNMAGTAIGSIANIKLSANWMVAAGEAGEDANLYDTVKAVGMELCPALGICIPVGKDSMSMRTTWKVGEKDTQKQVSPLSLLVTGFSTVEDVRKTVTPEFKAKDSILFLFDLGEGKNRLGASCLAQCYQQVGESGPDLDKPEVFKDFFACMQKLIETGTILSYHDRSDGGLFVTLAEMAIAGRTGCQIDLSNLLHAEDSKTKAIEVLFNEELGAVIEVAPESRAVVEAHFKNFGLEHLVHPIGSTNATPQLRIESQGACLYENTVTALNRTWSELSFVLQSRRDNSECAQEAYDLLLDESDGGLLIEPSFDPDAMPTVQSGIRPKIAVFREQGINGQNEMAFAFHQAGFDSVDVHMTDLLSGAMQLNNFQALVACGGFSYGDVLGAGTGWAKSILFNADLKDQFTAFFADTQTLSLGVCNGCQMLSQLKSIIPGADPWPYFSRNKSEQFEARLSNVEVLSSPSLLLQGMAGSLLPIPIAHGEGRADFSQTGTLSHCEEGQLIAMRYINSKAEGTEHYPLNPNGSKNGNTCFTTPDGRVTILMPHPERCFRSVQLSYGKEHFTGEKGPWMRLFENARSVFK
ncbi:MAG: phosphoribosylformylglycinamidine synthase [Puniceicoccaceae bacterium]|nr:phosphoribosylformylglycinamidine synthase [Puniceicoccaceae bacterium]